MVILLFGPPGSGKGTQALRISRWLGFPAVSTGALLRDEVARGTEMGRELEAGLARGEFASDEQVNRIVELHLANVKTGGIILDGYPRNVGQARYLGQALARGGFAGPKVIHLDVPPDAVQERLSGRLQCVSCGSIYHCRLEPPLAEGVCDGCGSPVARREDDAPEVVEQRLRTYNLLAQPVIEYYRGALTINGNRPPDDVFAEIRTALRRDVGSEIG